MMQNLTNFNNKKSMYKIIDNKLVQIAETGATTPVEIDTFDEKGEPAKQEVEVPIYTQTEMSPDPTDQYFSNMEYDLNCLKTEVNEKIKLYNLKAAEIETIKADCPECQIETVKLELK